MLQSVGLQKAETTERLNNLPSHPTFPSPALFSLQPMSPFITVYNLWADCVLSISTL